MLGSGPLSTDFDKGGVMLQGFRGVGIAPTATRVLAVATVVAFCLLKAAGAHAELEFSSSKILVSETASLLGLTVGELGGNGYPSLVATTDNPLEQDNETLIVYPGRGEGKFGENRYKTTERDFSISPSIGNYAVNGRLVIVRQALELEDGEPAVEVYPVAANGTLEAPIRTAIAVGGYLTAGELIHNGEPDIIYDNPGNGKVYVELGKSTDTFGSRKEFTLGGEGLGELALADVNGDGKLDLVATNDATGKISVSLGNGEGEFGSPTYYTVGSEPGKIAVADLNGDGKPDIVVSNYGSNTIDVLINEGSGKFKAPISYSTGGTHPDSLAIADFNSDGCPDIAVGNASSERVSILLNNCEGSLHSAKTFAVEGEPRYLVSAEFDSDSKPDLAVGYQAGTHSGIEILTNTSRQEEGKLQCESTNIFGEGATTQGLAQVDEWNPQFNISKNATACNGEQGTGGKPKVEYLQGAAEAGSGACLKGFGAGLKAGELAKFDRFTYCGTDEAPNAAQKTEIEEYQEGAEARSLETIPVLQVAVAIPIHLPAKCLATAEYKEGEKTVKVNRLVLRDATLEGIFRGTISTWKKVEQEEQSFTADKLTGTGCEPEQAITRVVRLDKSGTTHIFKEFLASANRLNAAGEENREPEKSFEAESFEGKAEAPRTWKEVASGSENLRWPTSARVVRPAASGGAEVVKKVAELESSIGYANLADVFANGKFDKEAEKGGEKQEKFWAEIQRKTANPVLYADPAVKKDTATAGNANCSKTVYANGEEVFPPTSTRELWNAAQSMLNSATYPLCGLTYNLALRQYSKYGDEKKGKGAKPTEAQATTAESYLLFELNTKTEGGSKLIENSEYEKLPSSLLHEVEVGVQEIGFEKSGVKFTCTQEATEGTGTLFYKSQKECETLNAPGSKGVWHR